MAEEKKPNLFDELEAAAPATAAAPAQPQAVDDDEDEEYVRASIDDLDDKAPADKAKREPLNGKIVTITGVTWTQPKTIDKRTGNAIPPTTGQTDATVKYYRGKLVLEMDFEGKKFVEYVPNIKFFVDDAGHVQRVPKFPREGNNQVAQLFQLYAQHLGKTVEEISDKAFVTGMVGLKVKLKTSNGVYAGKKWFRNDVEEIIKESAE